MKLLRFLHRRYFTPAERRLRVEEHLCIDAIVLIVMWGGALLFMGSVSKEWMISTGLGVALSTAFTAWRDRNAPL